MARLLCLADPGVLAARTLAYNGFFLFSTDVPSPTLSTAAGTVDTILFYNSTSAKWRCLAVNKGFGS